MMSSQCNTKTIKLGSIFEFQHSDAVQSARAILHTIMFCRCLGRLRSVIETFDTVDQRGNVNSVSFQRIDSSLICQMVENVCASIENALKSDCVALAHVQIHFKRRMLSSSNSHSSSSSQRADSAAAAAEKKGKKASSWTAWLANTIVGGGDSSAKMEKESESVKKTSSVLPPIEVWQFNIYIDSIQAQHKQWRTEKTLQDILAYASDGDDLPTLSVQSQKDIVTYPVAILVQNTAQYDWFHLESAPFEESKKGMPRQSSAKECRSNQMSGAQHQNTSLPINIATRSQHASAKTSASPPQWWNREKTSPGSGTWENGLHVIREVIGNVPRGGSSL